MQALDDGQDINCVLFNLNQTENQALINETILLTLDFIKCTNVVKSSIDISNLDTNLIENLKLCIIMYIIILN